MSSSTSIASFSSYASIMSNSFQGTDSKLPVIWAIKGKAKKVGWDFSLKCDVISQQRIHGCGDLTVVKCYGFASTLTDEHASKKVMPKEATEERVKSIKRMLRSMNDGEISTSAYDTAWVALVQDISGSGRPQFPASLEWIANNQLPDGSWGDHSIFLAHDRILNTLACLIALRSWNVHPDKQDKGMAFIRENLRKIGEENGEHMPIGFEVAFPSLIEKARSLGVEVVAADECDVVLEKICAERSIKLARIPRDIMHSIPTTLLHSLEGMEGLDWEKLIKLQSEDGSFLFSPASTAYALMETQDPNCLNYLQKVVQRFGGGVPNVYPIDMFEHIWAVDRLQRLGISRYFQDEIEGCMNYIHRYWTDRGICWARNSEVIDIDDTAMGFRLLRLHGYQVSPNVFNHFKKEDGFVCFLGQSTQAVTGMYNLHRASQLQFPGENILEEARNFSSAFLREKQASNRVFDKWIITKDLAGEVQYALDVPWYANLPRVETRFYIEQYGGEDDVWIGKTLYRMPYVSNNTYLELAKSDYNSCQALHVLEWDSIRRWYGEHKLAEIGLSQRSILQAYFIAAASIFEPEKSKERIAWAKTIALTEAISSYFGEESTIEDRRAFTQEFDSFFTGPDLISNGRSWPSSLETHHGPMGPLLATINELSLDHVVGHGRDILCQLHKAWKKWLTMWEEGDRYRWEAGLIARTIQLCDTTHDWRTAETTSLSSHPKQHRIFNIFNRVCHHLAHLQSSKMEDTTVNVQNKFIQVEADMRELVELVLMSSPTDDVDRGTKQILLTVAKSFYYAAYCSPTTIDLHITKVLFEKVV